MAIKRCVEAAYRHYIPRMGKPPGPMLVDYDYAVRAYDGFVVAIDETIAGVLILIRTEDGMLLDNVAVHPDHQGRGLGRRLLALAETRARDQGFAFIDLYTHECMTENIALYAGLGYRETGRRLVDGYRRVYMRKALG